MAEYMEWSNSYVGQWVEPIYTIPPPVNGTLLSTYCVGYDKRGIYADGYNGTYNALIKSNSIDCGFPPTVDTLVISRNGNTGAPVGFCAFGIATEMPTITGQRGMQIIVNKNIVMMKITLYSQVSGADIGYIMDINNNILYSYPIVNNEIILNQSLSVGTYRIIVTNSGGGSWTDLYKYGMRNPPRPGNICSGAYYPTIIAVGVNITFKGGIVNGALDGDTQYTQTAHSILSITSIEV